MTPADSGRYICQVNTEPKISLAFGVTIAEAFASIHGSPERYVQVGSTLFLDCKISTKIWPGQAQPTVVWSLNGEEVRVEEAEPNFWGTTPEQNVKISPVRYSEVRQG